jgi:AraC family transcriptional regulator, transcriptional activator of the genes for pyochelin and ferripyochelin receptors
MQKRIKNIHKRIMFRLQGEEFSKLVHREFEENTGLIRHAGKLDGRFECYTSNLRSNWFDILHFRSGFDTDLQVENFHDNTHVSLHFQLAGRSDADISGVGEGLLMKGGEFNLFNCVDPVSHFNFPRQEQYEYLCVGLKPSFFDGLLEQCGENYTGFLEKSQRAEGFSLFPRNQAINRLQWNALQLLQSPPVPDAIRPAYLKSKVEELTLLSLDLRLEDRKAKKEPGPQEREKLMAVRRFLEQHFLEELSLEKLSRQFLLNEFKLKAGFKQFFGITVFGYVHELRMNYAGELLESGGMTVGDVAHQVGYQTDAAFIRAFRLFYGVSPGKFN